MIIIVKVAAKLSKKNCLPPLLRCYHLIFNSLVFFLAFPPASQATMARSPLSHSQYNLWIVSLYHPCYILLIYSCDCH